MKKETVTERKRTEKRKNKQKKNTGKFIKGIV